MLPALLFKCLFPEMVPELLPKHVLMWISIAYKINLNLLRKNQSSPLSAIPTAHLMLAIQNTASRIHLPYICIRLTGCLLPVLLLLGNSYSAPKIVFRYHSLCAQELKHTPRAVCTHARACSSRTRTCLSHFCTPRASQFLVHSRYAPKLVCFLHCSFFVNSHVFHPVFTMLPGIFYRPVHFPLNAANFWPKGAFQSLWVTLCPWPKNHHHSSILNHSSEIKSKLTLLQFPINSC